MNVFKDRLVANRYFILLGVRKRHAEGIWVYFDDFLKTTKAAFQSDVRLDYFLPNGNLEYICDLDCAQMLYKAIQDMLPN